MASVPKVGKYVSDGGDYAFEIISANPGNGVIQGRYTSTFERSANPQTVSSPGSYAWVANNGLSGTTPFCVRFSASLRPLGREYCVFEDWTGFYMGGDTIVAYGSRVTVLAASGNTSAEPSVLTLGGLSFYFQG